MNFNDLWIMSIETELEKENFREAIRLAREGLGWSKNDLIKAVKIAKWKKDLDKIYLTDKPMG